MMSKAARKSKRRQGAAQPSPAAGSAPRRSRWKPILFGVGLVALGLLIYRPALSGPFVLDDYDLQEPFSTVRTANPRAVIGSGRPLLMLSFIANHRLAGGFDPFPFHLVNVLIHCLNALLLWRFAAALFSEDRLAGWGVPAEARGLFVYGLPLLFLTSPIQTESVAYISSRSELLATTFYIAGAWVFASPLRERRPWTTALLVIGAFTGAALSKQDKLTLPFAILLMDYLLLSRLDWRGLKKSWPTYGMFAAGLAAGFLLVVRPFLFAKSAGFGLEWKPYVFTQFRVLFRYLGQLIAPLNRNLNLDPDIAVSRTLGEHLSWLALVGLAAILAAAWLGRRRAPLASFGALWFFLALGPTTFFPLLDMAAERRLYLPSIGFLIVFLAGVSLFFKSRLRFSLVLLLPLALAYSAATHKRSIVWSDELLIWRDTVAKSPNKERPRTWLGRVYSERGAYGQAVQTWLKALDAVKNGSEQHGFVLGNLGLGHAQLKQYDEATRYYKQALEILPRGALLWAQLGVAEMRLGRDEDGWRSFEKAVEARRTVAPQVYILRGQELFQAGRYQEAAADFAEALRRQPDNEELRGNLQIARDMAARRPGSAH